MTLWTAPGQNGWRPIDALPACFAATSRAIKLISTSSISHRDQTISITSSAEISNSLISLWGNGQFALTDSNSIVGPPWNLFTTNCSQLNTWCGAIRMTPSWLKMNLSSHYHKVMVIQKECCLSMQKDSFSCHILCPNFQPKSETGAAIHNQAMALIMRNILSV